MSVLFPSFAEAAALAVVFVIALATRRESLRAIRGIEGVLTRVGKRRVLAGMLVALFAFILSASLSVFGRMPEPEVHDEFSNLLTADTFAHGRLTNPTHPMWVHFETFHVIHQPTYASKYPPAEGLMLALGQVLTGYPIFGVWLGTAAACAAIYWMLLAWVPAWLALLGGLMTALHPGILYWSQLFWGGQPAMIGGALVYGALPRIMHVVRTRYALLMGLGLAILANSRPYEGLVASVPIAIVLLVWMFGKGAPSAVVSFRRIVLPLFSVLAVTGAGMGYYNWRVTGDPLLLPYVAHDRTYTVAPSFLWQQPRPVPEYRHRVIRDYHLVWEMNLYSPSKTVAGFFTISMQKLQKPWILFQGLRFSRLVLIVPLLMLPWLFKQRRTRLLLMTIGFFTLGLLPITSIGARLVAPITGALIIVFTEALRRLRLLKLSVFPIGRLLLWAIVLVAIGMFTNEFLQRIQDKTPLWYFERSRIRQQLENDGGRHLIIVRYGLEHSPLKEWVYNDADIDGSKVVWAREMNPMADKELIEYFKDRKIWLLNIYDDFQEPSLTEYPITPEK